MLEIIITISNMYLEVSSLLKMKLNFIHNLEHKSLINTEQN